MAYDTYWYHSRAWPVLLDEARFWHAIQERSLLEIHAWAEPDPAIQLKYMSNWSCCVHRTWMDSNCSISMTAN